MNRVSARAAAKFRSLLILFGLILFLMGPGSTPCLAAHPGNLASALAKVQPGGAFEVTLRFDLLAYILTELPQEVGDAPMEALLDGPHEDLDRRITEAMGRFRAGFRAGGGGGEIIERLTFPTAAEIHRSLKEGRARLPVMASVTVAGQLPPTARTVSFRFDEVLGTVVLTTEFPYREPVSEPVDAGVFSGERRIPSADDTARAAREFQTSVAPAAVKMPVPSPTATRTAPKAPAGNIKTSPRPAGPAVAKLAASPGPEPSVAASPAPFPAKPSPSASPSPVPSPSPTRSAADSVRNSAVTLRVSVPSVPVTPAISASPPRTTPAPAARWFANFIGYVKMGYTHILPKGLDHILFIIGLFLLSARLKPLLVQVTAFTIAHSLTLALSLFGIVRLPPEIVEPIIAASIAFVAIENLLTTEMKPWRPAVVFGFGLIHGLGFAEALQELGLRQENLVTALLGFNVGVELGQLTVAAAAFILVGSFRDRPNYRKYVVLPASLAIAVLAIYWTIERLL